MRMLDMDTDSAKFRERDKLERDGLVLRGNIFINEEATYLPLYEAKMIHYFDHRFGTYEGQSEAQANQGKLPEITNEQHCDLDCHAIPRFWVRSSDVISRVNGVWSRNWFIAWRRNGRSTDERSFIVSIVPCVGVGDSLFLLFPKLMNVHGLVANASAFVFDYVARQKIGGSNMSYYIVRQLPFLRPEDYCERCLFEVDIELGDWIMNRFIELVYTSWDLESFAKDSGYEGPPFRWDENRRFLLRCELDAAFFHLYGIEHDDVDYIMETFPIVRKRDFKKYGD